MQHTVAQGMLGEATPTISGILVNVNSEKQPQSKFLPRWSLEVQGLLSYRDASGQWEPLSFLLSGPSQDLFCLTLACAYHQPLSVLGQPLGESQSKIMNRKPGVSHRLTTVSLAVFPSVTPRHTCTRMSAHEHTSPCLQLHILG